MLNKIKEIQAEINFSGSALVNKDQTIQLDASFGFANRSEQLSNNNQTRFGIASGCKLITAIAISQLVEAGKLKFDAKLTEILEDDFPHFDQSITVHHLLTHTSGIPDYFDEDVMDDFEELWVRNPMYQLRRLTDFLPLFQNEPMKLPVGETFHYNNAGYILLGLIVEEVSQLSFADYVAKHIFAKAGMTRSGYFEFDRLPENTALGYIDYPDGSWKTNIYSLPVKGGADGGAYVTTADMAKLWEALIGEKLLTKETTDILLTPHVHEEDETFYGYGVWIEKRDETIIKYHLMGYDPGVSFHSAFYPKTATIVVVCSNESAGAYDMAQGIEAWIN